ncbi:MAG: hypothetical protein A2020_07295 [Lentisphaerae bacterium GWF2_45_14]|nr:MAG: hypothetical protein A2020_07295 [Lentisphaerae bacterium GWF2_45_14]
MDTFQLKTFTLDDLSPAEQDRFLHALAGMGIKKVAVWGAGRNGNFILSLLRRTDIAVVAVYDANSGAVLHGFDVLPEPTVLGDVDCVIIAMNGPEIVVDRIFNKCLESKIPALHFIKKVQVSVPIYVENFFEKEKEINSGLTKHISNLEFMSDVLRKLHDVKTNRNFVEQIDSEKTVVATFSALLEKAFVHYGKKNGCIPDFLVADYEQWDVKDIEKWQNIFKANKARILSFDQKHEIKGRRICLFAEHIHWDTFSTRRLEGILQKEGLLNDCLLDIARVRSFIQCQAVPDFVDKNLEDISTVYGALSDEESRKIFLGTIKSLMTGDARYVAENSSYEVYDHPRVNAEPGDIIVDGGSWDGGTSKRFADLAGKEGFVFAFEPVSGPFANCRQNTADYPNILVEKLGLWSCPGSFFIEENGMGSKVQQEASTTAEECHCIDLDSFLAGAHKRCDLIKLDIEGGEVECIKGALQTLRNFRPKLQLSLYHDPMHYLQIPLLILRENLDYDFYIGQSGNICVRHDVLFARPRNKGKQNL